ncbi:MAG: rhodanese-like domain-containing protein [Gammaproteobacteria bacterium]|nr:rhodanese-like domain-containing protein [Gammaproteobacteria bacterium]
MRALILGVVLTLLIPPALAEKPTAPEEIDGITRLDAEGTVQLILNEPELVIIDARKREEYAKGHIEGAISLLNTTMDREKLAAHVATLQTPVLFYCNGARCLRSSNAAKKALSWGYNNLYWFRGGWVEWREKGLPVAHY